MNCTKQYYTHEENEEDDSMSNHFEHRLYQIQILLHAYTQEDAQKYKEEIEALQQERNNILQEIGE